MGQGHTWKSIWRTVLAAVVLKALVINKVLVKTDLPSWRVEAWIVVEELCSLCHMCGCRFVVVVS